MSVGGGVRGFIGVGVSCMMIFDTSKQHRAWFNERPAGGGSIEGQVEERGSEIRFV